MGGTKNIGTIVIVSWVLACSGNPEPLPPLASYAPTEPDACVTVEAAGLDRRSNNNIDFLYAVVNRCYADVTVIVRDNSYGDPIEFQEYRTARMYSHSWRCKFGSRCGYVVVGVPYGTPPELDLCVQWADPRERDRREAGVCPGPWNQPGENVKKAQRADAIWTAPGR